MSTDDEGASPAEEFMDWLDASANGTATYKPFGKPGASLTAITYRDRPRVGSVLGATLGLSLRPYAPGWGREVAIRVDETDPLWTYAVAHLVAGLLDEGATFAVGDTYDFGERISESSDMTGFLIGEPTAPLDRDNGVVHLSNGSHIVLVQAFPLYRDEVLQLRSFPDAWREQAASQFIEWLGDDAFNVHRAVSTIPGP